MAYYVYRDNFVTFVFDGLCLSAKSDPLLCPLGVIAAKFLIEEISRSTSLRLKIEDGHLLWSSDIYFGNDEWRDYVIDNFTMPTGGEEYTNSLNQYKVVAFADKESALLYYEMQEDDLL